MKIQVTPTAEQVAGALAHVWGCSIGDLDFDVVKLADAGITITTDLKGAQKAERALAKVEK